MQRVVAHPHTQHLMTTMPLTASSTYAHMYTCIPQSWLSQPTMHQAASASCRSLAVAPFKLIELLLNLLQVGVNLYRTGTARILHRRDVALVKAAQCMLRCCQEAFMRERAEEGIPVWPVPVAQFAALLSASSGPKSCCTAAAPGRAAGG